VMPISKITLSSIRIDDVRPIFMARVAVLVRRLKRGEALTPIVVTPDGVLVAGEHELHAARRLGFIAVDVIVKESP